MIHVSFVQLGQRRMEGTADPRSRIIFALVASPWLGASPDGLTVEIKCPVSRNIGSGAVPEMYMPQAQLQLQSIGAAELDFLHYNRPASDDWPPQEEVHRKRRWGAIGKNLFLMFHRTQKKCNTSSLWPHTKRSLRPSAQSPASEI
jgi:hypothetical protein